MGTSEERSAVSNDSSPVPHIKAEEQYGMNYALMDVDQNVESVSAFHGTEQCVETPHIPLPEQDENDFYDIDQYDCDENDYSDLIESTTDKAETVSKELYTSSVVQHGLTRKGFDNMINIFNSYIHGTHQPLHKY
ncbi:hypothetical protein INT45_008576, partial [Circinella minor]